MLFAPFAQFHDHWQEGFSDVCQGVFDFWWYNRVDPVKIGAYMQNVMTRRPELASVPRTPESQNNMAVYQVKPLKLRMLDNTVAPGHIDEVAL